MLRFIAVATIIIVTAGGLAACASEPEPEPKWTEESAYAAAEETFRAYWALSLSGNDRAAEAKYVTGDMQSLYADLESEQDDVKKSRGEAVVSSFVGHDFRRVGDQVALDGTACIDASTYELLGDDGEWFKPRDQEVYGVLLRFVGVKDQLLVEDLEIAEEASC